MNSISRSDLHKHFSPCSNELFFTRNDVTDPRSGDLVHRAGEAIDPNIRNVSIWGYPDDEGIANNRGRGGARFAPDVIRKAFYKFTPPREWLKSLRFFDHGNLNIENHGLDERHRLALSMAESEAKSSPISISLGGGHDYGYPDVRGWLNAQSTRSSAKPIVVNFDAHLDVRPLGPGGLIHSGTPFYRLLESQGAPFDFFEIGIQPHCHSFHHLDFVSNKGGIVISVDDFLTPDAVDQKLSLAQWRDRPVFISFDMDVFSSAVAPGCSQSFASGLMPADIWRLFQKIFAISIPSALGIYEASPTLDFDDQTSKLAAIVAFNFLRLAARHPLHSQTQASLGSPQAGVPS